MGRRCKAELLKANYYEWLADYTALKALKVELKKQGKKLTKEQKAVMKLRPTPDKPYKGKVGETEELKAPVKKKTEQVYTIDFDKDKVFKTGGGYFFCEVKQAPKRDENCMVFCKVEACPFYGVGYFRSKGKH